MTLFSASVIAEKVLRLVSTICYQWTNKYPEWYFYLAYTTLTDTTVTDTTVTDTTLTDTTLTDTTLTDNTLTDTTLAGRKQVWQTMPAKTGSCRPHKACTYPWVATLQISESIT